jgi:phosphoribosylamine--glycine ligase
MQEVIWPTVRGMEKDGITFTGFLYAGLMVSPNGAVKTLEFNCRMGDPETQPIMARLKTDLVDVLWAATDSGQGLADMQLDWDRRIALGVVLAAFGYPDKPRSGDAITGLQAESADLVVFHAGTRLQDDGLRTSGGRVLCVTALADTVRAAQSRAYDAIEKIDFDGMQWRSDIGFRALKR